MSTQPVPADATAGAGGVRRHHTISASSRIAHGAARPLSQESTEEFDTTNDDEVVDQDWVGGVGAVGEKSSSLHRQASLPTKYHRGFQAQPTRQAGTLTPRTMNSLHAIAGHDGDEEDWEQEMRGLRNEEEFADDSHESSPHSSQLGSDQIASPPLADSGVRRHQSLTYAGARRANAASGAGLKRAGTLQASGQMRPAAPRSPSPTGAAEDYDEEDTGYSDDYFVRTQQQQQQQQQQGLPPNAQQYGGSPGRSPWGTPGEWRSMPAGGVSVDDVQRALATLELASGQPGLYNAQAQAAQAALRASQNGSRKLQLVTDLAAGAKPTNGGGAYGPLSATASMPAPGLVPGAGLGQAQGHSGFVPPVHRGGDGSLSAHAASWDQKDRMLGGRGSNGNLGYAYQQQQPGKGGVPGVPPIPPQFLQQQQPQLGRAGGQAGFGTGVQGQIGQYGAGAGQDPQNALSPIDVPTLIATKGYNPVNFDTKPPYARYFVIKSYTEDDVHKSLKYEIWSSTDPGNKRLDKAFKETAGRGPIYLFFSVNASGHFCGMAEMLTPVDYTRSSTVWASDKWKGVFKVRWIFVRDIPNANLRHIKLMNTQERKPVTNSRDTQELLPEAGQEMLRIFHSHPARTSLLQDFAFYELQAMQKAQAVAVTQAPPSPSQQAMRLQAVPPQPVSPSQTPQHPFAMSNPAALAYATQGQQPQQLNPMMQMGMSMGGGGNGGFSHQATMQSVMRNPSPAPSNGQQQQFMNMAGGSHF